MYVDDARISSLARAVADLASEPGQGVMLLLAEEGAPDLEALVAALAVLDVPFFGGVFPGLIDGGTQRTRGAVLMALPLLHPPVLVERLDAPLPERFGAQSPGHATVPRPTALLFVDGLSTHTSAWMRSVYAQLGTAVTYLGGGAGSLSFQATPCLFTQDGVTCCGAVMALTSLATSVGVQHGWARMAGPHLATRTHRNQVRELNWRPAVEVYGEAIGHRVDRERFFDTAKAHPFGIRREGQEDVVRDPLSIDEAGSLVCAGEVPQNAVLHILEGAPDALIAAAGAAATEASAGHDGPVHSALVIDCISRTLFLQERLDEELQAICSHLPSEARAEGALTLGEIGSRGESIVEWMNKTVVVGVLHADD